MNVLIFPGGTEIGLEVRQSLMYCRDVKLFSAAAAGSNHAPFAYNEHYVIPDITEAGWLDALESLIQDKSIDYVFGCHEDVLLELVRNDSRLSAAVIAPPLDVVEAVRSKRRTYGLLQDVVRTPRVYDPANGDMPFPVFVKPDRGAGSRGAQLVHDSEQLQTALSCDEDMIVSEWVPGLEMTVDCFTDRTSGLLYCQPRVRVRMRNGISMDSYTVTDSRVDLMASAISGAMDLRGAWFFQVRESADSELVLLEIGARIAGTMAVSRCNGVNLPLLSIYEHERRPISIAPNELPVHVDRALVNRFMLDLEYSTVYVDLDDTLILDGKVNTALVGFLYQCFNRGCRIVVLTRHAGDPDVTLRRYRLSELIDEVRHLSADDAKSSFIDDGDAIFIDDSYGERADVHDKTGIPTFDCSMLEILLDGRA